MNHSWPYIYQPHSFTLYKLDSSFRNFLERENWTVNTLSYDSQPHLLIFVLITLYSELAVTSAILFFGAVWFCFASPASATGSGFQRNLHQTPSDAKLTRRKIFSGICTKHKQIRCSAKLAPTTTKNQTHPSQKNWILGHCFSVVQCSFAVRWLDTPPF